MDTLSPDSFISQLKWRYATKRFDPAKKIPAHLWTALEEALVLAPSSFGLQPWKFLVISDPALRKAIRSVAWNQPQIEEASHLVVFAAKNKVSETEVNALMDRIVEVRKVAPESLSEYRKAILGFLSSPPTGFDLHGWAARQVYLALGGFLTSAAVLGIDACPMEGFSPSEVDKILNLSTSGYSSVVMVTAGYRATTDGYAGLPKVRYPREKIIEVR